MLTFAVQKKFRKKNTSSSGRIAPVVRGVFRRIPISFFWILFAVIVLIWGIIMILRTVLFTSENTIQRILYDTGSVLQYDDPYLYKQIRLILKGENYYLVKGEESKLVDILRETCPFVDRVQLDRTLPGQISVHVDFFSPQLILRNQQQRFGVYNGTIFPLFSGNSLGSGAFVVDLPDYTSGLVLTGNLKGFFFAKPFDAFVQEVFLLRDAFPRLEKFVYLIGGQRSLLYLPKGKVISVNHLIDIPLQIHKYNYLQTYYTGFSAVNFFDLGSLEKDKVIVTK